MLNTKRSELGAALKAFEQYQDSTIATRLRCVLSLMVYQPANYHALLATHPILETLLASNSKPPTSRQTAAKI
jgi:hypothetical protein